MAASTGLFLARATATRGLEIRRAAPAEPFALGVASGDPSTDGFVPWTRLSAGGASLDAPAVPVAYEVAAHPDLIVQLGDYIYENSYAQFPKVRRFDG